MTADDLDFLEDDEPDAESDAPPYPVLVVDDDDDVHAVTRLVLGDFTLNGRGLALIPSHSAAEAAEKLAAGLKPAVILLDVVMETHDAGLLLAARIRDEFDLKASRIVLRTGQPGEAPERDALLRYDINDYRAKTELTDDRLFAVMLSALRAYEYVAALEDSHAELERRVEQRTRDVKAALASNDALLQTLQDYRKRLDEELAVARETQRMALPSDELLAAVRTRYRLHIESRFETSSELGGDFWHVTPLDDHQLAIMVVDFSGHGVGAALNAIRLHGLAVSSAKANRDPAAYLERLNAILRPLLPIGQYATMFYGVIDIANGALRYAPAACPSPFLRSPDGAIEELSGRGYAIGMLNDVEYEVIERPFPPGAALLLYSDAMYEAPRDPDGAAWEMEGFAQAVETAAQRDAQGWLERLQADFDAAARKPLDDDLTAVVIWRGA